MDYDTFMPQKQDIFTQMGGKVRFYPGQYNPTSDAVWLAAFAPNAKTVLDVGIGSGGISLCYLANNPDAIVTGIDISESMLADAARNSQLNNRNIELINTDIFNWRTDRTFDLVMTNPPYFKGTPATHNAHHNVDLNQWTRRCIARVKPRGHFCTIVDAAVTADILAALVPTCGDIAVFPLFGAKDTAERALIRAKLGAKGGTRLFSGTSMNNEQVLRDGLTIDGLFAMLKSNV